MALTITLSNTSGASYVFSKILQFQLKKEVYTPYTTFSAQFRTDGLKKVRNDLQSYRTERQSSRS